MNLPIPADEAQDASKTVLIVEDQLEIRAINSAYLQHHGYHVLAAESGPEGLRVAREADPDVVLMDISIPGMDGITVCEALKRDPTTRHIPVIIVTAHPYGSVGARAHAAGCDGYITKPCDPRRLLQEVQRRVGTPQHLH